MKRLHMNFLLSWQLINTFATLVNSREYTIGMIWPETNSASSVAYERTGSIFTIALEDAQSQGMLQNTTMRIVKYFSSDAIDASGKVVSMIHKDNVDLVFGHPHSSANLPMSYITSYYNIPHISWSATDVTMSQKEPFKTLIRTNGPFDKVGRTVTEIMREFGWGRLGLYGEASGVCFHAIISVVRALQDTTRHLTNYIEFDKDQESDESVIQRLDSMKNKVRIIALCSSNLFRKIMLLACQIGMCNGEYVFIDIYTNSGSITDRPWHVGDSQDVDAKMAYRHVLKIVQALWVDDFSEQWVKNLSIEVPLRMIEDPWNSTVARDNGYMGSEHCAVFYDAAYLWFLWLNHAEEHNLDHRDGRQLFLFTHNFTFKSPDGNVYFDDNGDREPVFWILDWKNNTGISRIMATVDIRAEVANVVNVWQDPLWVTADGLPPLDSPWCGFDGSGSQETAYDAVIVVDSTLVPFVVIVIFSILIATYYRKTIYEKELIQMSWKVDFKDVFKDRPKTAKGSVFSRLSLDSNPEAELGGTYKRTGKYREIVVSIRMAKNQSVLLTRQDFVEFKKMKELVHVNVNPFVGSCIDSPNCCALFQYCTKGSLQDMLQNDGIKLDWTIKMSMISDCLEGLIYIASSALRSFGKLKSSNCVVDDRWVLKLTDYGMSSFTNSEMGWGEREEEKYKALLWTAPELLRTSVPTRNGTQAGDIYAFGIVLHEIIYRLGVFPIPLITAKDIVEKVRTGGANLCRPMTDYRNQSKHSVIGLMKKCWVEDPLARPPYHTIRKVVRSERKGKKIGILDNLIKKLEKYENNIEELVEQRTVVLTEEKRKTDMLLYKVLPKHVAEKLKCGQTVEPEVFKVVTLFFSDIVGFTRISAACSPMQIVDLLHELYSLFDDIIEEFDVYKIETTGDAYMVVGGLSRRGGNKHASEIADMSLAIQSAVTPFKMRHTPNEQLKVRIGLHSGMCCAGVVGQTMPRYSLFGDTVNTASRMESNGEGQRIHISDATRVALLPSGKYVMDLRGEIEIKGKGKMTTYWLSDRIGFNDPLLLMEK